MTQNTISKVKSNKTFLIVAVVIGIALLGVAAAATMLTAPEHVTGTPIASPTPTPTPSPSPTPAPTVAPIEFHLTSNNTTPFYKGDTLRITAQLTQAISGANVTLSNNGAPLAWLLTDASGKAVFDRSPLNPFDYTATASIP